MNKIAVFKDRSSYSVRKKRETPFAAQMKTMAISLK
jgi:hypothetical protein